MKTVEETLGKYLRPNAVGFVRSLQQENTFDFRITNPRNSKHGDFKFDSRKLPRPVISVNGNLNPDFFLFTFLHEYAHLISFRIYGARVQAHGKEWKDCFRKLLMKSLEKELFPSPIAKAIRNSLDHLKSTTMGNIEIYHALLAYNGESDALILGDLDKGESFIFKGRRFLNEGKRRTRYLCKELSSGKQYLIHGASPVEKYEE